MGSRKRNVAPGTEVGAGQQRPITVLGGPSWGNAVDKNKVSAALRDHRIVGIALTARPPVFPDGLDDLQQARRIGAVGLVLPAVIPVKFQLPEKQRPVFGLFVHLDLRAGAARNKAAGQHAYHIGHREPPLVVVECLSDLFTRAPGGVCCLEHHLPLHDHPSRHIGEQMYTSQYTPRDPGCQGEF
jgi:hypothetical protein